MPDSDEQPPSTASNKAAHMETSSGDPLMSDIKRPPIKDIPLDTAHQHIWFITGPAGCGKSTIASYIAESLKLPCIEGDNFHPQANIDKMSKGHPLDDQDRWDWLIALRIAAVRILHNLPVKAPSPSAGSSQSSSPSTARSKKDPMDTEPPRGVVLTCSALKRKYRDVLRIASYNHSSIRTHFLYLDADQETLIERVKARKGHYMGAEMVKSQFESLEIPTEAEWDVVKVDVGAPKEKVESDALKRVEEIVRGHVEDDKRGVPEDPL